MTETRRAREVLSNLLNGVVSRSPHIESAMVVSPDGLVIASSGPADRRLPGSSEGVTTLYSALVSGGPPISSLSRTSWAVAKSVSFPFPPEAAQER